MKYAKTKIATAMLAALAVGACNTNEDDAHTLAKNYIFAVDGGGYINVFADDGTEVHKLTAFEPLKNDNGEVLPLGEIHFANGKAFVVISDKMTHKNGTEVHAIGGGFAVIDIATNTIEKTVALETSTKKSLNTADTADDVAATSRIVHTYLDPDGKHIWFNNDGPSGDKGVDSVFRVNVDPTDSTDSDGTGKKDDKYLDIVEIVVGNGHKKSAFAEPSTAKAATNKVFATHNLTENSLSLIDNNPDSASFLTVLKTVDFTAGGTKVNTPHGLAFSPVSGHLYTGITNGADMAVSIVDATDSTLPATSILAGAATETKIPAAGYMKTSHDGSLIFTVGYKAGDAAATPPVPGKGYLSVIDAATDTVKTVLDIGDISASSIAVAEMDMDMDHSMHSTHNMDMNIMVYVPSGTKGGEKNVLAVAEIDHHTGQLATGKSVQKITVGLAGGEHRNGKVDPQGARAYMPNGGAGAEKAISVIDTMTNTVVATLNTAGDKPSNIGILDVSALKLAIPDHND